MNKIGQITFEWVEPRMFSSKNRGELEEEDTIGLMDVIEGQVHGEDHFAWEVEVGNLTGMSPAARRVCAERLRKLPDRAIAVVNAKFAQRVLVNLILTAVAMLDGSQRNNKVAFFDDSAKAREWLRDYLRNQTSIKKSK